MADIHDEIMAMPMSHQTLVGDRGSVLSGGQKQHILLLLEHSTASLRFCFWMKPLVIWISKKEAQINQMIKSLNITRVMIAYRPETIASAY